MKTWVWALATACVLVVQLNAIQGQEDACETAWAFYKGSCYRVITGDGDKTFDKSGESCTVDYDGWLTSIGQDGENNFLIELVKESGTSRAWFGLRLFQATGYTWVDSGRPQPNFLKWPPGEPTKTKGCVHFNSMGVWKMKACNKRMHFICRKFAKCPADKIMMEDGTCIKKCQKGYHSVNGTCEPICGHGFTMVEGKCIPECKVHHCDHCETPNVCAGCKAGYYLGGNGHCHPCDVPYCLACNNKGGCVSCEKGYIIGKDGRCVKPCNVAYCLTYAKNCHCKKCKPGYVLLHGKCKEKICNPKYCHANASCHHGKCKCNKGFYGDGVIDCHERCVCRLAGDPMVDTYDHMTMLVVGNKKYTLSKCMKDPLDPCGFNIEIKVGALLRKDRIKYALTSPRYLDISILGARIRMAQNHRFMVDDIKLDVDDLPFYGKKFVIYSHRNQDDYKEKFIVFSSKSCGIKVGFYGNGVDSVALVSIPGRYSGCMIGFCGDCNGLPDDLKTRNGKDVSGLDNMFQKITDSYEVDDSYDNPFYAFGKPWSTGRRKKGLRNQKLKFKGKWSRW